MLTNEMSLEEFIRQELPAGSSIGMADLERVLGMMGVTDANALTLAGAALKEWGGASDVLESHPSGWRIDSRVAQTAIASAMLLGALSQLGYAESMPVALATALLPALISIERVRLTPKEHAVMVTLVLYDRARTMPAADWYEELPAEIKNQLNKLDFTDFLDKFVKAGYADREGDDITIFPTGKGKLAICFGKA